MKIILKSLAQLSILQLIFIANNFASNPINKSNLNDTVYKINWVLKADLPLAHRNGKAVASNGRIYYIGGYCTETEESWETSNYEYDPQEDKWQVKEKIPIGRSNFAIASFENRIFVIGGDTLLPGNDCYLPEEGEWKTLSSLLIPRQHIDCGRIGKEIYVVGGLIRDMNPPEDSKLRIPIIATNTVEIYNIEENKWIKGNPLPEARHGVQVAVVNDKLYTIGGAYDQTKGYMFSSAFNYYNPELDKWESLPNIPIPLLAPGVAVINERIFIIGGSTIENGAQAVSNKVFVYNVKKNNWELASSLPKGIQFAGVTCFDNKIYIIGGCDVDFNAFNSVYEGIIIE
jgi:Kelch motif